MLHVVFDRGNATIKAYDSLGSLYGAWPAGGDAWGNYGVSDDDTLPAPPYGHACWCPPGHFNLQPVQFFDPPIDSEGFGQIPVEDLDTDVLAEITKAGRATVEGTSANIGGIILPLGQLAQYERSAIMVHCGGSNSPDPLADNQGLYRTFGCTRMLNKDWKTLANWLAPQFDGNNVILSLVGNPVPLDD